MSAILEVGYEISFTKVVGRENHRDIEAEGALGQGEPEYLTNEGGESPQKLAERSTECSAKASQGLKRPYGVSGEQRGASGTTLEGEGLERSA
jgi:hypothetical protein